MDNFDLTKFLAEGKLHEAMSPQDVVDIADTVAEEFTKESADEGDFMIYSVGEMDVDDMTFELDTDTTAQTPERILKMSNLGVGEGWGGSFRISPKEEGYEVRNSEKGGLVAIIDGMGNFKMISADEARAEMGMADGEKTDFMQRRKEMDDYMEEGKMLNEGIIDTIKDKMVSMGKKLLSKFSPEEQVSMKAAAEKVLGPNYSKEDITLDKAKEIGKIISGGLDESQQLDENLRKKIGATLVGLGLPTAFVAGHGFGDTDVGAITAGIGIVAAMIGMVMVNVDEGQEVKEIKSNKMKKSELKEMIKAAMLENARTDAEEEGYLDGMRDEKEDMKEAEDVEVEDDENVDVKDTENVDVDIEKDVKVDDEESEVDIDVKASMPGESEDVEEVQALLMKAQEAAEAFGDEKLMDQIGNTITYFTRSHVAGNVSEMDDMDVNVNTTEMEAELGLEEAKDEEVKENLNESVMFPMWNKIK
ncbi:hypothetical protein OAA18_00535 [bacterium]|nr:hypothetical protein [bacterium]